MDNPTAARSRIPSGRTPDCSDRSSNPAKVCSESADSAADSRNTCQRAVATHVSKEAEKCCRPSSFGRRYFMGEHEPQLLSMCRNGRDRQSQHHVAHAYVRQCDHQIGAFLRVRAVSACLDTADMFQHQIDPALNCGFTARSPSVRARLSSARDQSGNRVVIASGAVYPPDQFLTRTANDPPAQHLCCRNRRRCRVWQGAAVNRTHDARPRLARFYCGRAQYVGQLDAGSAEHVFEYLGQLDGFIDQSFSCRAIGDHHENDRTRAFPVTDGGELAQRRAHLPRGLSPDTGKVVVPHHWSERRGGGAHQRQRNHRVGRVEAQECGYCRDQFAWIGDAFDASEKGGKVVVGEFEFSRKR